MEDVEKAIIDLEYCIARYGKENSFTFAAYKALSQMKAMQSRIAELEKDAARLDWMINQQAFMEYERDNYWLVFTDGSEQKQSHNSARQAIDTAMRKD